MMSNKINVPFSPPDIKEEEIQEVARALRSGWITTGPRTKEFEKQIAEYVGTKRAVCLNSATACMEMVLRAMGIGAGDEVITTAQQPVVQFAIQGLCRSLWILCRIPMKWIRRR